MSGDLMHKGIMELVEAKADTITVDDYIPVYQKRTLQVMKVRVGDLISAITRLAIVEPLVLEQEDAVELEEVQPQKTKSRGRKKKNEQS